MDALVTGGILAFGNFRFDLQTRRLLRQDAVDACVPVPIGSRALEILAVLLTNPGAVVSKDAIMSAVWPGVAVEPNNLTVHMAALRRALDQGRSGASCIQTVPGRGYRLAVRMTPAEEAQSRPVSAPTAEPDARPQAPARPGHPIRLWRTAAAGAVAIVVCC